MDDLQGHQNCRHHWMIEPAASPESRAHCASCGSERLFSNAPVHRYDRDPAPRMEPAFRSAARSSHRERIELTDEA